MSQELTRQSVLESHTVVDTDVHISTAANLPEDLEPYVDEPYLSRLRRHNKRPITTNDAWDRSLGGKIDDNYSIEGPSGLEHTLVDEFGVDYPVLNPTSGLPRIPSSDFAVAMMSAYNDWMMDTFLDESDCFYGLAAIAPQHPDKAAEELDRLGDEDQIVGVYIRTSGPNRPLGDPAYDVMYQAAQDNDLAIGFHGGAQDFPHDFSKQYQTVETFLTTHTLAHPWSQMLTLTNIIVQGVPVKFPELNYVFMEAGLGWAGYLISRLNMEYKRRRSEAPLLEKPPEEYIRDTCYFTQQPLGEFSDPENRQRTINIVGADSIVFSTDFPHWDFDHPSVLDEMFENDYHSEEERNNVLGDNAIDIFDLPV